MSVAQHVRAAEDAVVHAALARGYLKREQLDQALAIQGRGGADLLPVLANHYLRPEELTELKQVYSQALAAAQSGHGSGRLSPTRGAPGSSPPLIPRSARGAVNRIGRYQVLGEIARGGFGVVYRALHPELSREVAIKVLLRARHASPTDLARFQKEADAAARLRHPNIVTLHDAGWDGDSPFLVFDLIEGGSLQNLLNEEGALSLRRSADITRKLAAALHYSHDHGILHRDVKPMNVLLTAEGEPMLMDFGLAKETEEEGEGLTQTGDFLGTVGYAAPEQVKGEIHRFDARLDVYALGATLYAMLTGEAPFANSGNTPVVVMALSVLEDPDLPSSQRPEIDRDIETICMKCLEKDPAARYQTAALLADDLERYLGGRPIQARPPTPVARLSKWAGRNPGALKGILGAALLALTAAGLAAVYGSGEGERQARIAKEDAERARAGAAEADARVAEADDRERRRETKVRQALSELSALLDRAVSSPEAIVVENALNRLARSADERTVSLLAARLDAVSVLLEGIERAVYREAEQPDADEARAGQKPILGIAEALERRASLPAGAELPGDVVTTIGRAAERILRREGRKHIGVRTGTWQYRIHDVVGGRQEAEIGPGRLLVARLSSEALGRIGIRMRAVESLTRHLRIEADEQRAVAPGLALCALGGGQAASSVRAALSKFDTQGHGSLFSARVRPAYQRIAAQAMPASDSSEPRTAADFAERGEARLVKGDAAGAIEDLDRAIGLRPDLAGAWGNRGLAKQRTSDLAAAIEDFERWVQLEPKNGIARGVLAGARQDAGDLPGALRDYERALELSGGSAAIWHNMAGARAAAGDVRGAIQAFGRAIQLNPRLQAAWSDRAFYREKQGDLDGAVSDYTRALALDPDNVVTLNNRGEVLHQKGDLIAALADLNRAVELKPSYSLAWVNRAQVRVARGNVVGGIADYGRALKANPKDAHAWTERGVLKFDHGDIEGAIEDHRRAVEVDPKNPFAWNNLGSALDMKGDYAGAIAAYTRSFQVDPRDPVPLANRARAHWLSGDLDAALTDCDRAIALDRRCAVAWKNRALVHYMRGDVEKALTDGQKAVALGPEDRESLNNLAVIQLKGGDEEAALATFDRLLELDPNSPLVLSNRGFLRATLGDLAGSRADLDKAITLAPRNSSAWNNRGWTRHLQGDEDGALTDCDRAIQLDPKNADARGNRAYIRQARGELEHAEADAKEATRLDAKLASPYLTRGLVAAKRGSRRAAMSQLERFLELDPRHHLADEAKAKLKELRRR